MIALMIAGAAVLLSLSRRMDRRGAYVLCWAILWTNFALHFLKQLNPYYLADFPYSLRTSSLENLCAVTIVASPFVYLYGPRWLKGYCAIISVISGIVVYLIPTGAMGKDLSQVGDLLEALRFYLCHFPLIAIPLIMLDKGFLKVDLRDCWTLPWLFMAHLAIPFLNECCLKLCGLVEADWLDILSRDYRNSAWTNGLASSLDAVLGPYLYWALPHFTIDGVLYFVPAIWPMLPLIIFAPWIGVGFAALFDPRGTKAAWKGTKARFRRSLMERKAKRA